METAGFVTDTLSLGDSKFMVNEGRLVFKVCVCAYACYNHVCYDETIVRIINFPITPNEIHTCTKLCCEVLNDWVLYNPFYY